MQLSHPPVSPLYVPESDPNARVRAVSCLHSSDQANWVFLLNDMKYFAGFFLRNTVCLRAEALGRLWHIHKLHNNPTGRVPADTAPPTLLRDVRTVEPGTSPWSRTEIETTNGTVCLVPGDTVADVHVARVSFSFF